MTSGTEFLDCISFGPTEEREEWRVGYATLPDGRRIRVETHTPEDANSYLAINADIASTVDMAVFLAAVEYAFKKASEQGYDVPDILSGIIQSNDYDEFMQVAFERGDDIKEILKSFEEYELPLESITFIRLSTGFMDFTFESEARKAGVIFSQSEDENHPVYEYLLAMIAPERQKLARQFGSRLLKLTNG